MKEVANGFIEENLHDRVRTYCSHDFTDCEYLKKRVFIGKIRGIIIESCSFVCSDKSGLTVSDKKTQVRCGRLIDLLR